MWIIWLFLGFAIGVIAGFVLAVRTAIEIDKKAISDGVIKLCGKLYALKEIDL